MWNLRRNRIKIRGKKNLRSIKQNFWNTSNYGIKIEAKVQYTLWLVKKNRHVIRDPAFLRVLSLYKKYLPLEPNCFSFSRTRVTSYSAHTHAHTHILHIHTQCESQLHKTTQWKSLISFANSEKTSQTSWHGVESNCEKWNLMKTLHTELLKASLSLFLPNSKDKSRGEFTES